MKVFVLPGADPVDRGVFRHVRHPNYLGVILEIAALPLIHGAWITAALFSAANGVLLWRRVRAEERALSEHTPYAALMRRPRWIPIGRAQ